MRARLVALAAIAAWLAACGTAAQPTDDTAGPGLPVRIEGEQYPGRAIDVDGSLVLATNGCFLLEVADRDHFVVWPERFGWGGDAVVAPDGTRLVAGTRLRGAGTALPLDRMPGGADGYWASVGGFCDVGTDVVVLDRVEVVP